MREQTMCLHSVQDLRDIVDDAKGVLTKIDWRTDFASLASRREAVEAYAKDLATQFAETLTTICNVACNVEDPKTAERVKGAILDVMSDEFAEEWRSVAESAEHARSPEGRAEEDADRRYDEARESRLEAAE